MTYWFCNHENMSRPCFVRWWNPDRGQHILWLSEVQYKPHICYASETLMCMVCIDTYIVGRYLSVILIFHISCGDWCTFTCWDCLEYYRLSFLPLPWFLPYEWSYLSFVWCIPFARWIIDIYRTVVFVIHLDMFARVCVILWWTSDVGALAHVYWLPKYVFCVVLCLYGFPHSIQMAKVCQGHAATYWHVPVWCFNPQ